MYVMYAVGFMMKLSVILTMELHPAQNGKTFPRILSALCAA